MCFLYHCNWRLAHKQLAMSNAMGIGDWGLEIGKDVFSIYISLIRSEFSAYLCAPTLREGKAHLRLNFNPQFATILPKAVLST